jgi:hypothetical protein
VVLPTCRRNKRIGPLTLIRESISSLNFQIGQYSPSTFVFGQTHPYGDIILHNNIIILHDNMRFIKKSSLPLAPSSLNFAIVYFLLEKYI